MSSAPSTCRTWFQTARGKPNDVLKLDENAPVPKPNAGEVLIKIHSAGLNPVGYKLMALSVWPVFKLPAIPELDFSGTIVDGNGTEFKTGQAVLGRFGSADKFKKAIGALTEYTAISAENIILKPDSLPFEQAAGLPTVGLTAYQCLSQIGYQVKPGSSVFINGGSSSVGQMAIQIAKNMGSKDISVSCSEENHPLVKDLGADEAYDYKSSPLVDQLRSARSNRPFDLIVDVVGSPELFTSSTAYLKEEGAFVTIAVSGSTALPTAAAMLRPTFLGGTPRAYMMISTEWSKGALADMFRWQGERKLQVPIDSTYGSDQAGVMQAYGRIMSERAKGKVIVNFVE